MRLTRAFRTIVIIAVTAVTLGTTACQLQQSADAKFGDQSFKTAISLIELYRVRHGAYPAALTDLDFTGDWDAISLNSVRYERLPDGYALDVTRGWIGKPTLSYPPQFWQGLGLRRTNVGHLAPAS
jgi:hypothetical protein